VGQIDLDETHWPPIDGGFRHMIRFVDEHAHILLTRTMSINRAAFLAGAFDLYTVRSSLHRVIRIAPLNDQIRVAVEVLILHESASVLCHGGREHIRNYS
jgi:hypothetical protein